MFSEGEFASAARRPRKAAESGAVRTQRHVMALGGTTRSAAVGQSFIGQAFRVGVLLLPFTLLAIAALRFPGSNNPMLWLATAFQIIVCLLTFLSGNYGRQAIGPSVI